MVASDRQVMYWAPDKKTAVALKCLSTHSAVVQSFTSDTARAEAVYRSSGHAISQLLSRNKSGERQELPGLILQFMIDETYY